MKTIVIAGASGLVGRGVLPRLLAREDVAQVVALGRRESPEKHSKLVSRVADLQRVEALADAMPATVDIAVCCLGTTIRQAGSQEAFRAVDRDAVVTFAQAARKRGAQRFVLVSSLGADARSRTFYLKTKGETEEAVRALGYAQVTVLRPSFIDDEGQRTEHRPAERWLLPVMRAVFAVVGRTRRYAPIRVGVIATALVRLAFDETPEPFRIVESERLHRLGA